VQLVEMVLLIQQLQENVGTPKRVSKQTPLIIDKNKGTITRQKC